MKSEAKKRRVERCDQYARNLEMAAFSYDFAAACEEWRVERCEKQHRFRREKGATIGIGAHGNPYLCN